MPERPRPTPGEVEGATESEEGEAEVSETRETAAARPERMTPERRGFWSRLFRRQRPQTAEEVEAEVRKVEQEAARVERGAAIALGEKPSLQFGALTPGEIREMMQDPERLPDLIENLTPEQFRRMQMESIHGTGRMTRWREYTSGDREFELGENGEIRRDSVKELKRRGRGVLLKALPGAALLIAGCFTAGATLPAAGAVLGSLVGSGAAEAWEASQGKLNGLREQIAKVLYSHLIELRDHAKKYKEAKESGNEEEAYKYLEMVVSKFHEASEKAKEIHCQFLEKRKRWDRFKGIAAAIGGLAGLAAGALGFAHHLDLDKLKGAGELSKHGLKQTHHWVRRINGAWQFMYGQGEPLPGHAARTVFESGGQTWHTIGPHQAGATWEILKKGLAVIGAGAVASIAQGIYRRGDKARFEEEYAMTKEEQERHQAMLERRMPARPEPSGGAEAQAEAVLPEQQKYAELAQRERKTLPAPDQIWFMIGEDGKPIFFKIKSIDWKTGKATIDYLGFMAPGAVGAGLKTIQENEIKDLEDIIRNWTNREDYANKWAKAIKDGDIIVVLAGRSKVTDLYDPSRKHRLKPGQYRFKRIGEEGDLEAELIDQTEDPDHPDRKGNRAKVSIFDLAWAGVVPKEAQKEERRVAKPLAERQLWMLKDGVGINDVPEELRAIAEHGIYINEIENPNDIENSLIHVYGVDENGRRLTGANRSIRDVSVALLRQYFRYAETATGGGGGREQQQRAGGGGGGRTRQGGGAGAGGGGGERGGGGGERRT